MASETIFFDSSLIRPSSVIANTDLNDYSTPGIYECPTNAIANTVANVPGSKRAFTMFVFTKGTSKLQVLMSFGDSFYARNTNSSGVWQDWYAYTGTALT